MLIHVPSPVSIRNLQRLRRDPLTLLTDLAMRGDVVEFWAGPQRMVLVNHPDCITAFARCWSLKIGLL